MKGYVLSLSTNSFEACARAAGGHIAGHSVDITFGVSPSSCSVSDSHFERISTDAACLDGDIGPTYIQSAYVL
ncbi:hypothetical protein B0H67DRAFT_593087 [Lasiosphaeris hirsuta]|uniref:Uncharacterized protein n=1 Tax=Lasiosphaeris hirsuta TaxID=260670 RepID=A0AA39ZWW3_9PEZI|nr:hypothetical protein B0H67DRAFT_593087 [Lasiosphaeris hirsuta]